MYKTKCTQVEILVLIALLAIVSLIVASAVLNNRGATENRALSNAAKYLQSNNISPQRLSCAGDSNHDGYGTCNVVTQSGEKIILKCPTDWMQTEFFGASGCKEVFMNFNLSGEVM